MHPIISLIYLQAMGKLIRRVYYNVTLNSQLTILCSHVVQFTMHRHIYEQLKAMLHDNDYSGADMCTQWPTCSLPEGSVDFCTKLAKGL